MKNYINQEIDNLLVNESRSIKFTLKIIQKNGYGATFITDNNKKLLGIMSDGDVRKAIIKGAAIEDSIKSYYNKNIKYLQYNSSNQIIQGLLNHKIKIIPLVNRKKIIVDFATAERIKKIPISEPFIFGKEYSNVKKCLDTNWLSSKGPFVTLFEKKFYNYLSRKSLAVTSGTTGIELALRSLNLKKGDEIILPVLTFAATVNSVINAGLKPVFIDTKSHDFNIDENQIEKKISKKTKAIMAVHLYGRPCNMSKIQKIAKKNKLFLLEDCAESIGSKINNKAIGSFSDISIFSFFGNKTITTGEGGMVCFKNNTHYKRAFLLRDHGMNKKKKYWHDIVGHNFRLTNLQAAIGCAQFEKLDEIVNKKILISNMYKKYLSSKKILIIKDKNKTINSHWLFCFFLKDVNNYQDRDKFLDKLNDEGVEGRNVFYPLCSMKIYKNFCKNQKFPHAENFSKKGICLPTSYTLNEYDIKRICKSINSILN
tara:strand:- start:4720 stop:6168 length:1449 start_codon:yes stop_codon:yes gene_type:complete